MGYSARRQVGYLMFDHFPYVGGTSVFALMGFPQVQPIVPMNLQRKEMRTKGYRRAIAEDRPYGCNENKEESYEKH